MIYLVLAAIVIYVICAGAIGVATNPNKRYPENAQGGDHLWVLIVIIGLPAAAVLLLL